jgi:PAS domain S-box-containing protein
MIDDEKKSENEQSPLNGANGVILGQLLAAQNLLFVLPNKKNIASFYAPLLLSIPGVRSCRVCLGDFYSKDGGFQDEPCANCPNRKGVDDEFSTISKDIECQYVHKPSICTISLETSEYRFGNFVIEIDQSGLFELYKPFIHNLGNFLALTLENRLQKNNLETANKSLEFRIEKRTEQLQQVNLSLLKEMEERSIVDKALSKLNRELMAISSCNQVLIRADDEQTLLNEVCKIICDKAGYGMVWVGYAEHDEDKTIRPVAWAGLASGYIANTKLSWSDQSVRGLGPGSKSIRSGEIITVKDFDAEQDMSPWHEAIRKRGYKSGIALPLKDDNGNVFGALVIYSSEIDAISPGEVKLLEELSGDLAFGITSLRLRKEHKLAVDALQKSEAHYHSLFDRVIDGVYRSTHDGKFVDINPAMVNMFGYSSKQEMLEVDIRNDLYFAPEDRDSLLLEVDSDIPEVYRMRRKDGSEIWVEDNGSYEKDDQGNTTFHEGILRDVTKRKMMEEELIKAKENAESSDRLKTAFLQNISHEIRTPMNAICGFSKILNSPDLSHEDLNNYAGIIQSNIDQLLSIINDIVTISSIETHQEKLDVQLTSLNDIMNEMFNLFNDRLQQKKCTLTVEKTLNNVQSFIYSDGNKLSYILNNLLSNALKFTENGTVHFGYNLKDNEIEFFVKDTGIGIQPEMQDIIFDHFRKANNNNLFGLSGTGLGLSIAKGFVELLDGTIWVESEVGKGSVFYFTIPYKPAS